MLKTCARSGSGSRWHVDRPCPTVSPTRASRLHEPAGCVSGGRIDLLALRGGRWSAVARVLLRSAWSQQLRACSEPIAAELGKGCGYEWRASSPRTPRICSARQFRLELGHISWAEESLCTIVSKDCTWLARHSPDSRSAPCRNRRLPLMRRGGAPRPRDRACRGTARHVAFTAAIPRCRSGHARAAAPVHADGRPAPRGKLDARGTRCVRCLPAAAQAAGALADVLHLVRPRCIRPRNCASDARGARRHAQRPYCAHSAAQYPAST